MRNIPSQFTLSCNAITLDDVSDYYDKSRKAIESYYDPSWLNPALVGLSPKAAKSERENLLRELNVECGMMLMSAVEAAFRTDFVLRCRKSKKEKIDTDFKDVLKGITKLYQVRIKEDLIDRWAEEFPGDKHFFSQLKSRFDYRNWIAHGRYWNQYPKAGTSSTAFSSMLVEVQAVMALIGPYLKS